MGQKGSTLSARSQEFLVSLTKVSNQKIATSLICYQQKGEWRREYSSTCSPWYLPLFSPVTFTCSSGGVLWVSGTSFSQGDGQGEELMANCQCPTVSTRRNIPILMAVSLLPRNPWGLISMCFARQHFPLSFLVLSGLILLHVLCITRAVLTLGSSSFCSLTKWLWLKPPLSSCQQRILLAINN